MTITCKSFLVLFDLMSDIALWCDGEQELDLTVEEEFLDLLLKLVRELPMTDIYQMDAQPASQPTHTPQDTQTALQVSFCPLPTLSTSPSTPSLTRQDMLPNVCIGCLVSCMFTVIKDPWQRCPSDLLDDI